MMKASHRNRVNPRRGAKGKLAQGPMQDRELILGNELSAQSESLESSDRKTVRRNEDEINERNEQWHGLDATDRRLSAGLSPGPMVQRCKVEGTSRIDGILAQRSLVYALVVVSAGAPRRPCAKRTIRIGT